MNNFNLATWKVLKLHSVSGADIVLHQVFIHVKLLPSLSKIFQEEGNNSGTSVINKKAELLVSQSLALAPISTRFPRIKTQSRSKVDACSYLYINAFLRNSVFRRILSAVKQVQNKRERNTLPFSIKLSVIWDKVFTMHMNVFWYVPYRAGKSTLAWKWLLKDSVLGKHSLRANPNSCVLEFFSLS